MSCCFKLVRDCVNFEIVREMFQV